MAGVAHHRPSGLDDQPRMPAAEMIIKRAEDGVPVRVQPGCPPSCPAGRPPPRSSSQGRRPATRTSSKISAAAWMGASQAPGSHCWEPTWNVTPAGRSPRADPCLQQPDHLSCGTAELARQRPVRSGAGRGQTDEDRRARRRLGELVDLGRTVGHEELDAVTVRIVDVGAPLHRMRIDHLADIGTGLQTQVEFRRAGHVESAAGPDELAHQVRMGIGLHRIVHRPRSRKRPR